MMRVGLCMNKMLFNEWVKLKNSKVLLLSIILACITPLIGGMMVIILNSSPDYAPVSFLEFMSMILRFITKTVGICFYTFISAEIVSREFRYDTFKSQLMIPISRTNYFFIKLIIISMWIIGMTMLSYFVSLVISLLIIKTSFTLLLVRQMFFTFLKAGILVLPFSYFTIACVVYNKHNFLPMTINIVMFIVSLIASRFTYYMLCPFTVPFRVIFSEDTARFSSVPLAYAYLSLFILAAVSILVGHYQINKMEL